MEAGVERYPGVTLLLVVLMEFVEKGVDLVGDLKADLEVEEEGREVRCNVENPWALPIRWAK